MYGLNLHQKKYKFLVVDDHELILSGTINAIRKEYPDAEVIQAQTARAAIEKTASYEFDLVVIDLSIPETVGVNADAESGIKLLKNLMRSQKNLNIVVQTASPRSLVRLKPAISSHEGGFTVADKGLPISQMLIKVNWSLQGHFSTPPEIRSGIELKPEWLELLQLAFKESLQDSAIAKRMSISESSVRHYWKKIYDVLEVHPDQETNMRIKTEIRAREKGLID
jgi:DNA-binding NarL/FixJ family response regulator